MTEYMRSAIKKDVAIFLILSTIALLIGIPWLLVVGFAIGTGINIWIDHKRDQRRQIADRRLVIDNADYWKGPQKK